MLVSHLDVGCAGVCVSHLDVGCVEISEGGQGGREAVGATAHPQSLQNTGGHTCPLTLTLREREAETGRERHWFNTTTIDPPPVHDRKRREATAL